MATQGGVYLRRRIKHDGTPECAPMLPHDRTSRASSFGLVDVSAQPVAGATLADFDPLERERLRQAVQQYGGDRVLLELDDEALDGALGLTARQPDGSRLPTLTGLLLVGREAALQQRVPTHEFAFQVLAQQAVKFNEFRRYPLLKAVDWLETNFRPYNPEEELQVGLFRVPVPLVDMGALPIVKKCPFFAPPARYTRYLHSTLSLEGKMNWTECVFFLVSRIWISRASSMTCTSPNSRSIFFHAPRRMP